MSTPQRLTRPRTGQSPPPRRLVLKFDPRAPLTDRLLRRLSSANADLRLERTAEGALIVMAPAGAESGRRNALLTMRLGAWSEANGLGHFFDSSTGFRLPSGAILSPDASWIARERWEALTPAEQARYAPICPDFVVELRSPSDLLPECRDKMRQYRAQGARLGWLIDPKRKAVEIYRPGRAVETLANPATLSGEDTLPGFILDLKGILAD